MYDREDAPDLVCKVSNLSCRSVTFVMFSLMIPTVSSICCWIAAVLGLTGGPDGLGEEPLRAIYGS